MWTSPIELIATQAMIDRVIYCDNFTYSGVFLTGSDSAIGALGQSSVNIQIDGDADFVVQNINIVAFDTTNPPAIITNPNLLITLTASGSGRELMNQPQHVLDYAGNFSQNHVPSAFSMPRLLSMMTTLKVTLQNLGTTVYSRIDVALLGFKVFYVLNPDTGEQGTRQSVFHVL